MLSRLLLPSASSILLVVGCSSTTADTSNQPQSAAGGGALSGVGGELASGGSTAPVGGDQSGGAGQGDGATSAGGASAGGAVVAGGGSAVGGSVDSSGGAASGGAMMGPESGGASASNSVFPVSVTTPKIMIVGDSIAAGPGCFKKFLKEDLEADEIDNFEFVGEYTDDCGGGVRHSAVSCSTAEQYSNPTFTMSNCAQGESFSGVSTLMPAHNPDMVLLQLGVNDMWGGGPGVETMLGRYEMLVEQMRAHNPQVVVVVAQIHKVNTTSSAPCADDTFDPFGQKLIEAVPGWAASMSSEDSPVLVADLWTNSFVSETKDCVHPTDDVGAERMGENWFNAIADLLR